MTDLLTAMQNSVWQAVKAGVPFPFYVSVPQGTKPPFGKLGTIEAEDAEEKGDNLERHEVELIYVYQGGQKTELTAMIGQGRTALEAATLAGDGVEISRARWLSSTAGDVSAADGITFAGISRFEIYITPA